MSICDARLPLIIGVFVTSPGSRRHQGLAKKFRAMVLDALQAAWLWQHKGDRAVWEALIRCTGVVMRLSLVRQLLEVHHADVGVDGRASFTSLDLRYWPC